MSIIIIIIIIISIVIIFIIIIVIINSIISIIYIPLNLSSQANITPYVDVIHLIKCIWKHLLRNDGDFCLGLTVLIIFKLITWTCVLRISRKIALRWIPQDLIDDYLTLFQVMVMEICCYQNTANTTWM